jgi:hypothetical protein
MNMKSTAILGGCIIVAAVILALTPRSEPPATEAGRFQLIQSEGGYVVLDTRTGEVREQRSTATARTIENWSTATATTDWQKNPAQQWRVDTPKAPSKPSGM